MKKLLLCIMDGIGIRDNTYGNAVKQANTPNLDYLMKTYPNSLLEASETAVGLPIGQMGNSEVGHMNIGTGRIVNQSLDIISNSINDGSLSQNNELLNLIKHVKENDSDLHICGLLSDGGIHSHIDHLMGLIDILKNQNIKTLTLEAVLSDDVFTSKYSSVTIDLDYFRQLIANYGSTYSYEVAFEEFKGLIAAKFLNENFTYFDTTDTITALMNNITTGKNKIAFTVFKNNLTEDIFNILF